LRASGSSETSGQKNGGQELHEKLEALFNYIKGALCRYWGIDSCSTNELVNHLQAVRGTIWRWGSQAQASFRVNSSMKSTANGAESSDEDEA
jgi:hypothetical protein